MLFLHKHTCSLCRTSTVCVVDVLGSHVCIAPRKVAFFTFEVAYKMFAMHSVPFWREDAGQHTFYSFSSWLVIL